jgi:hypothetical protein
MSNLRRLMHLRSTNCRRSHLGPMNCLRPSPSSRRRWTSLRSTNCPRRSTSRRRVSSHPCSPFLRLISCRQRLRNRRSRQYHLRLNHQRSRSCRHWIGCCQPSHCLPWRTRLHSTKLLPRKRCPRMSRWCRLLRGILPCWCFQPQPVCHQTSGCHWLSRCRRWKSCPQADRLIPSSRDRSTGDNRQG